MIALTSNNKSYCLKRDTGEIVWSMEEDDFRPVYSPAPAYRPIQISLEMDRRLNTGIILFPQEYGLTLINILNGDTLTHYSTRERISYVSEFDLLEKSIYMIKGNKLYKVRFDIIS
jgi:outer membrane protein assembly factor BamB